jgi:uncharacterized protein
MQPVPEFGQRWQADRVDSGWTPTTGSADRPQKLRGGYPEAVRRDPGRRRARFFDSYVTDLVTCDVRQTSDIERPAEMRRLLSVVAARMGSLAVVQPMANDIALPRQTLSRYLDLLELVFVIKRIPAWSSNLP